MQKLRENLWARVCAVVLLFVFLVGAAVSGMGVLYLTVEDVYRDGGAQLLRTYSFDSHAFNDAMDMARNYYTVTREHNVNPDDYDPQWEEDYLAYFAPKNTNFYFGIYDEKGKLVFQGGEGMALNADGETDFENSRYLYQSREYILVRTHEKPVSGVKVFTDEDEFWEYADKQYSRTDTYGFDYELNVIEAAEGEVEVTADVSYVEFEEKEYTIVGYVREKLTANDSFYRDWAFINGLITNRNLLIAALCVFAALSLAVFVFLMCAAGHKRGAEGIYLSRFDRIPLDVLVLAVGLGTGVLIGSASSLYSLIRDILHFTAAECIATAIILTMIETIMLLPLCMSFAARCKVGGWYKNSVIYFVLRLCGRALRRCWEGVRYLCGNLPLYWKAGLLWFGLCGIEFLFLINYCYYVDAEYIMLWFIKRLIFTALIAFALIGMKKLLAGGARLAAGELQSKVDTKYLFWDFKRHAENLNAIGDGMQKAVEQQMRSERLKTELITNVSHDIKTPLTSIVNYVDLLKKEPLEPPQAREYLEVLDRQSARLKKLTEDLVEASKASTGNLSCKLELTDVNVLLGQVMGEYTDRLHAAGLEPVMQLDEGTLNILADGRLLWRVFDNLLSNICKYAMSCTRVYLSSIRQNGRISVTFKNISKYALNITPEELMERFVRGDSSRSTEGSGLGLSIANSLTSLQGGEFNLVVDGDLFKASVSFAAQ